MDNELYIFVSAQSLKEQRDYMFLMSADSKSEATKIFKELDSYKSNLDKDKAERLNIHIWGGFEIKMLRASGAFFRPASSVEWIISRCESILLD